MLQQKQQNPSPSPKDTHMQEQPNEPPAPSHTTCEELNVDTSDVEDRRQTSGETVDNTNNGANEQDESHEEIYHEELDLRLRTSHERKKTEGSNDHEQENLQRSKDREANAHTEVVSANETKKHHANQQHAVNEANDDPEGMIPKEADKSDDEKREDPPPVVPNQVAASSQVIAAIDANLHFKNQSRQWQRRSPATNNRETSGQKDSLANTEPSSLAVSESTGVIGQSSIHFVQAQLISPSQVGSAAPVYDMDAFPITTAKKRRRFWIILLSVLTVIGAAAIGGGVAANQPRQPEPSLSSSFTPSSVVSALYPNDTIFSLDTPQSQALEWLENPATAMTLEDEKRILVRYALATFYFAMNGKDWSVQANFISADHECDWNFGNSFGVSCNSARQVAFLSLPNNGVGGQLPAEIGILTDLTILNLRGDVSGGGSANVNGNFLSGTIPGELGALTNLIQLDLSRNGNLAGTIPTELANLTQLVELRLEENVISGTIPEFLSFLPSLTYLSLGNNQLTGAMPPSLDMIQCVSAIGNNLTTCELRRRHRLQAFRSPDLDYCVVFIPPCELPS